MKQYGYCPMLLQVRAVRKSQNNLGWEGPKSQLGQLQALSFLICLTLSFSQTLNSVSSIMAPEFPHPTEP